MDDLISRQAAIEALEREKTYCTAYKDGTRTDVFKQYNMGLTDGIKALNKLTSAERTGTWSREDYLGGYICYRCSECGQIFYADSRFCPFCGSRNHKREDHKL